MEEIKKMKIGDPLDRSTDHGPQNHKAHLDKLIEYCDIGVKEGATLVYGGHQVPRPGELLLQNTLIMTSMLKHKHIHSHTQTAWVGSTFLELTQHQNSLTEV